jgi:hypothetical protein
MQSYVFIVGYCALSGIVAHLVQRKVKGFVGTWLLSPTLSAIILQIVAYLYLGYVDAWADIAFVTSWLIALACSVAMSLVRFIWKRIVDTRQA